jgi:hypothetical protein
VDVSFSVIVLADPLLKNDASRAGVFFAHVFYIGVKESI